MDGVEVFFVAGVGAFQHAESGKERKLSRIGKFMISLQFQVGREGVFARGGQPAAEYEGEPFGRERQGRTFPAKDSFQHVRGAGLLEVEVILRKRKGETVIEIIRKVQGEVFVLIGKVPVYLLVRIVDCEEAETLQGPGPIVEIDEGRYLRAADFVSAPDVGGIEFHGTVNSEFLRRQHLADKHCAGHGKILYCLRKHSAKIPQKDYICDYEVIQTESLIFVHIKENEKKYYNKETKANPFVLRCFCNVFIL